MTYKEATTTHSSVSHQQEWQTPNSYLVAPSGIQCFARFRWPGLCGAFWDEWAQGTCTQPPTHWWLVQCAILEDRSPCSWIATGIPSSLHLDRKLVWGTTEHDNIGFWWIFACCPCQFGRLSFHKPTRMPKKRWGHSQAFNLNITMYYWMFIYCVYIYT